MTTSDIVNLILAGFTGCAVIVSIIALVVSRRANHMAHQNAAQSNEIQAKLLAIEQERERARAAQSCRAKIAVGFVKPLNSHFWRLELTNQGETEARNIDVTLDGRSVYEIGQVSTDGKRLTVLGAGAQYGWTVVLTLDGNLRPPWETVVTWEDDSGQPGRHATTLTF